MTLNDLEWCNNPYCTFFSPNSIALLANYVKVIEDRHKMSVKYSLRVTVFYLCVAALPCKIQKAEIGEIWMHLIQ